LGERTTPLVQRPPQQGQVGLDLEPGPVPDGRPHLAVDALARLDAVGLPARDLVEATGPLVGLKDPERCLREPTPAQILDRVLEELAGRYAVELRDLRKPPEGLSVPTGANLEVDAKIVLTVGSDCAIGKKTVAVELDLEARRRGLESVFVPTGQTGIVIAGWGIAVDAVVSDFLAGAAERLVVEGARRGGKLLLVEGQGSLVHPMYSGVTLGLIHGSAPHAFVLCHRAGSTEIEGCPGHAIPPLADLVELHERIALPRRPAKVACVALNTGELESDDDARETISAAASDTGLPTDDPVRFGSGYLLDALLARL